MKKKRARNKDSIDKLLELARINFERGLIRWECMRRDLLYRENYKTGRDYEGIPHPLLLNPDITKEDIKDSLTLKGKRKDKDIDKSACAFIHSLGGNNDFPFNFLPDRAVIGHKSDVCWTDIDNKNYIKNKEEFKKKIPNSINVTINLNYNKTEIMLALEAEIDKWIEMRKLFGLHNEDRTPDYKIIERDLEIYDIRKKEKLIFKDIAKKKFPAEYRKAEKEVEFSSKKATEHDELYAEYIKQGDDVETAYKKAFGTGKTPEEEGKKSSNKVTQLVIDSYNVAVKLVEQGGYKEIR